MAGRISLPSLLLANRYVLLAAKMAKKVLCNDEMRKKGSVVRVLLHEISWNLDKTSEYSVEKM